MSVHIDELDPKSRVLALKQIEETRGSTTALAILEDNNHSSTYTPAEMRARSILSRMDSLSAKLKTLEDDIRILWADFDNLKADETILGCASKKEFCERKLNRTPRAVRYMLAGGNPDNHDREEIISPVEPSIPPVRPPETVLEPDENPDANIEDAVLALPDSPELDEAVEHPPAISAAKKVQPTKPDAKVESRLKMTQREWASVTNPAIGRITITASNVGSDVETSLGRYDLLLSGVSKPLLDTLRAVLPNLSKESLDRMRKLLA